MTDAVTFIQVSDMHLGSDPEMQLLGVNTHDSFQAVLELIQTSTDKIDFVLATGDLAQDGSAMAYTRFAEMVGKLTLPVYYVPGNHDTVSMMQRVYPLGVVSNHKHLVLKHWHIILLNSNDVGAVSGRLSDAELSYLKHCLASYPEHHALIVFHHPPVLPGTAWLDPLGLVNADAFWETIAVFPKVRAVLFGHVHMAFSVAHQGVTCLAAPSTCFQFNRAEPSFRLEALNPGYRWVKLQADGRLETGIVRTDRYIGVFDAEAKGY